MTFTEAALEVLRSAGKPLHYKKITEIAIEKSLLSHVGKAPEMTMSSRLATLVKRSRGNSPIVKVRPGVFAVRKTADPTGQSPDSQVEEEVSSSGETDNNGPGRVSSVAETQLTDSVVAPPGADLFPEEEGDDDPIFSDAPPSAAAGVNAEQELRDDPKSRRRRRRRRRTKVDGEEDAVTEEGPSRPNERDRPPLSSVERDSGRRSGEAAHALDWNRQPADGDLLGKNLADAVRAVLLRYERHPVTFLRAAELLVGRGRLSGSASALAPTIAAAVRADVSRSEVVGSRPRFRVRGHQVGLTDWLLSKEALRAEEAVMRAAQRQREQIRRALVQKLNDLPTASFAELVATWLNAEGVVSLRAVRRPGSSNAQLHLAGTLRRGVEETRLAIVVRRDQSLIDRESVVAARGGLHHYGNATSAWLATTGRIASGAWEEAAAGGTAPCALLDGMALATAMERVGVGLRQHSVSVTCPDFDLFEALGDKVEVWDREERDRDKERERGRRGRRSRLREDTQAEESRPKREDRDLEVPEETQTEPSGQKADTEEPRLQAVPEETALQTKSLGSDDWPGRDGPEESIENAGGTPADESPSETPSQAGDISREEPETASTASRQEQDPGSSEAAEAMKSEEPERHHAGAEGLPEASAADEEPGQQADAGRYTGRSGEDDEAAEFDVDDSVCAPYAPARPLQAGTAAADDAPETPEESSAPSSDDGAS